MRANAEEQEFSEFLLQIGNGEYPHQTNEVGKELIKLPNTIICKSGIVTEIYGNKFRSPEEAFTFPKVAILAPNNEHCQNINGKVLDLIAGETRTYVSVNNLITENDCELLQFPTEFLYSLELNGLPPHILELKAGSVVMLLRKLKVQ
ncbi:hypothetical protein AVEN_69816-1 [Araneus ventricosus]|uniref:DNA helicase Pif1-like 2B domain-containing protein n=1 Tax=Araneus ventricosus TaxID=182803 RepID=A0A4Y2N743_ARAVE|nr:hypothetical protein AVEN_69816-1 [Araneus ventricosus]